MIGDDIVPVLQIGGTAPLVLGDRWSVAMASNDSNTMLSQLDSVGVILIHSDCDPSDTIATIRTSGRSAAAIPIAVMGSLPQRSAGEQPDLWLTGLNEAELSAALEPLRPIPLSDSYHRIEATFGAETVRGMAQRLCAVLVEALDALGTLAAAATAHRVAGVAGTLGFADLGARWLELSHDPDLDTGTLERDTRRTIAAIVLRNRPTD